MPGGDIMRDTHDIMRQCDARGLGSLGGLGPFARKGVFYPDYAADPEAAGKLEAAEQVIDELYFFESLANSLSRLRDKDRMNSFLIHVVGVRGCKKCLLAGPLKQKVYDGLYAAKEKRAAEAQVVGLPPRAKTNDDRIAQTTRACREVFDRVDKLLLAGNPSWRKASDGETCHGPFLGGGQIVGEQCCPTAADFMLWSLVDDTLQPGGINAVTEGLEMVQAHHKSMSYLIGGEAGGKAVWYPGVPMFPGDADTLEQQPWLKAKLPRPINPHPKDKER